MHRRRPPGAGPGLSTTVVLAVLLFLPFISSAAQQQQQPENARRRSLREDARVVGAITLPKHGKHTQASVEDAAKRSYAPIAVLNERAVATTVPPAPANPAVRALPARNAASSGGLSRPSARSLQDWEVEDFVLLATVDGHIHARDRYDGKEIWELNINKPMLETIYNTQNDSEGIKNMPFLWIVEPKEDGTLYVLTPGPYPVLQSLGMTVKQLAEVSPYSSDDPPVVYVAEKRNSMHVVDARTGNITKSFSAGGSMVTDGQSCSPKPTNYFDSESEDDKCKGFFNLGQTEYIVSIQNKNTGANICTIKYAEWTPNNRDRDLQVQYLEPHENQYIYSRYDGHAIAYDHKRPKRSSKYLSFQMKLSSPVVRVFDIARPLDDDDLESALVLLPQPPGPAIIEDKAKHVWLNTTDSGSWYALSEASFPAVTDSAPPASCYTQSDILSWDGPYYLPDRSGLVGVHVLDYQVELPSHRGVPGIAAPVLDDPRVIVPVPELPPPKEPLEVPPETLIESRAQTNWWPLVVTLAVLLTGGLSYQIGQPTKFDLFKNNLLSRFSKPEKVDRLEQPMVASPFVSEPEIQATQKAQEAQEAQIKIPAAEVTALRTLPEDAPAKEHMDVEPRQRKVMFNIPDDEDADLEPLSRTTTAEQPSPVSADEEANALQAPKADVSYMLNGAEGNAEDPAATPTKKKKAHRGKRGGRKLSRGARDKDEVDRIVDAVKHLDQTPTLHPDERTMNDQDIQDVSNVKRIGKLTIDCDRLLGNGSGGTFVFEGKWNDRDVAIKRMLPQYFGLAEQEVKLLQESDLHQNVIRYFDDEKDENFLYIAVELCQASLFDLYHDGRPGEDLSETQQRLVNEINADVPSALRQLAKGVNHLHSLRIIHRDIKPQNILIAYPQRNQRRGPRLVISDFGLCKTLPDNVSTLIGTTGNAGTTGWKAPELILQPKEIMNMNGSSTGHSRDSSSSTDPVAQGVKRAVDIFSLGCVFFYVLTNGSHPFDDDEGWMQIRELNIKKDKANFKQLALGDDSVEPIHLISWMLSNRPEDRPTASQVINHPFFWTAEKRLNFLCDCSDHWEREPREPPSGDLSVLESYSSEVLDKKRDFLAKLDRGFILSLGKQRKYTGDRMLDLLRALRNKKNHYEDMEESVKAKVGPLPEGYLKYWTIKFPRLVMSCYEAVVQCGLQEEPRFKGYFLGEIVN